MPLPPPPPHPPAAQVKTTFFTSTVRESAAQTLQPLHQRAALPPAA
jgi:hypothetical protein